MSSCSDEDVEIDPPAVDSDEDEQTTDDEPEPEPVTIEKPRKKRTVNATQRANLQRGREMAILKQKERSR